MNAQERDQLQQFLATLRQQRVQAKDPVADALIRDALAGQPDAAYVLVQRTMALTLALQATQQQLQQLQQLQAAAAQAASASDAPQAGPSASPVQAPAPQASTAPPSLWMRGLVRQVGGTALGVATGVVAGGVLLQGLQALWGDEAAFPANLLGGAAGDKLSASSGEGDSALWDLGDDWV
jgi:hypothetical protein